MDASSSTTTTSWSASRSASSATCRAAPAMTTGWRASRAFYVGPHDIFPEEFLPFLGLQGRIREFFLQAHGDLLGTRWWREVQERVRAGEIVDIFPYREDQRLHHAWA